MHQQPSLAGLEIRCYSPGPEQPTQPGQACHTGMARLFLSRPENHVCTQSPRRTCAIFLNLQNICKVIIAWSKAVNISSSLSMSQVLKKKRIGTRLQFRGLTFGKLKCFFPPHTTSEIHKNLNSPVPRHHQLLQ
jgi:hypothetical protein